MALLAFAGGLVALTGSPASAGESEAAEASDLIEIDGSIVLDLLALGLDATLTVAGTGVADVTVIVGP